MSGLKRQLGAISGGLLLTFCGGIHIGWSILHYNMAGNAWAVGITIPEYRFATLSFFTGVCAVLVLLGQIKNFLSNRVWLMMSAFFFLINGLFFILMPIDYVATVATNIIAGFGHGIAHVIMIIYIGEISHKEFRAKSIALLTASIVAGIAVFSLLSMLTTRPVYIMEPNMHPNRAFGLIIMPFSCIACVLTFFLMVESPMHVLWRQENEAVARQNLRILRNGKTAEAIDKEFNDIELLVGSTDSGLMESMFFTKGNRKVFGFCAALKLANWLVFNYTINMAKIFHMSAVFTPSEPGYYNWAPSILMLSKLVAACFTVLSIDVLSRRIQYTISTFVTGACLVTVGILLAIDDYIEPWIVPFLYITAEVFNAMGMLPISEILTAEVFPLHKKAMSVVGVLMFEYLGQIVLYIVDFSIPSTTDGTAETILLGGVALLECLYSYFKIPDTRGTTLDEAIFKFVVFGSEQ